MVHVFPADAPSAFPVAGYAGPHFPVCFSAQGLPLRIADYMPAACHEHGIGSDMEVGGLHFKPNPVHNFGAW